MGVAEMAQLANWMDTVISNPDDAALTDKVAAEVEEMSRNSNPGMPYFLEDQARADPRSHQIRVAAPRFRAAAFRPLCTIGAFVALFGLRSVIAATSAQAGQVIELLDKTKVAGEIVHFYDGVLTVGPADGNVKFPQDKIRRIVFDLPKPRAAFSTPQKTHKWKNALKKGNMGEVIDCYALMFQGMLASQMGGGEEMIKQMKKEIAGTVFTIKNTKQKGDRATDHPSQEGR